MPLVCVCMFVCNSLLYFALLPIDKIVLMQICSKKLEKVYYEYCSNANKNIKKSYYRDDSCFDILIKQTNKDKQGMHM